MLYNVDFLIAGWVLTTITGLHVIVSRHGFMGLLPKLGYAMLIAVWVDCSADIVASVLISAPEKFSLLSLYVTDIVLYLAQSSLSTFVFLYSFMLCGSFVKENRTRLKLGMIPFVFLELLILLTPFTGLVFSFDPITHAYSYGPLIAVVFVVPAIYAFAVAVVLARNFRFVRNVDMWAIGFYFVATIVTVIYQAFYPHTPIAGLTASICLVLMYTTLCNSKGIGDTSTGVFCAEEFRRRIAHHVYRGTFFDIVFVALANRRYLTDVMGIEAVDSLIRDLAKALMRATPSRQVYRLHGARFAVISYDREVTQGIVSAMRDWMAGERVVNNHAVKLNGKISWMYDAASAGKGIDLQSYADYIADYSDSPVSQDTLAQDGTPLLERFVQSQKYTHAIEKALADNSFELVFQPIYSTREDAFVELEALSRLSGPDGPIPPQAFIELAEEIGVMVDISRQQFNRLCRIVAKSGDELLGHGIRRVKYNVSAIELASPDLGKSFLNVIKRNKLDPAFFSFEITETAAIQSRENLVKVIGDLKAAGCDVCLDDFGSGYANLSTLMDLPFDVVKIDKSLLDSALADRSRWLFYCKLINVVHSLDKVIIAEGVETQDCAQELIAEGVDMIQGFLYARPYPINDLLAFLDAQGAKKLGCAPEGQSE